jgi:hypothetical protein
MAAVKIERSVEQFAAGVYPPEWFDQLAVNRGGLVRRKRCSRLSQHDIEPLLDHLIAQHAIAGLMRGREPFERNSMFTSLGSIA